MKKFIVLVFGLVVLLAFTVSCSSGVAQSTYDKAVSDLTAKTAELSQAKTGLDATNTKLAKVKNELAIFNGIFIPALDGTLNTMSQADQTKLFQNLQAKVDALKDAKITSKFAAITSSSGGSQETTDFFLYLLQDMENALK
jgi:hypothetical protein